MSNHKSTLFYPSHLKPDHLEQIFSFSPTKKREFIKRLQTRKSAWADRFKENFYPTLWQFLGEPSNWPFYQTIARQVQNRKNPLVVNEALSQFQMVLHKKESSDGNKQKPDRPLSEIMDGCLDNKDIVDRFVEIGRPEFAAEAIWCVVGTAFADSECLNVLVDELLKLSGEEGKLASLVQPMVAFLQQRAKIENDDAEDIPLQVQWASNVESLNTLIATLKTDQPDYETARKIQNAGRELGELAKELLASAPPDLSEIERVLEQLADLLNEDWKLFGAKGLIRQLSERLPKIDEEHLYSFGKEINEALEGLQRQALEIRDLKSSLQSSSHADRRVEQLYEKSVQLWQEGEAVQKVIAEFFDQWTLQCSDNAHGETSQDEPSFDLAQKVEPEDEPSAPETSGDDAAPTGRADSDTTVKETIENEPDSSVGVSAHKTPDESPEINIPPRTPAEIRKNSDVSKSEGGEAPDSENADESGARPSLTQLIRQGNFELAYWTCEAMRLAEHETPIEPAFLGAPATALAKAHDGEMGSKMREFLNAISRTEHFDHNEQILAATTLITTSLLAGAAAQTESSIQALANRRDIKSNIDELDELTQFVVDSIIRWGWAPTKINIVNVGSAIPLEQRLRELSEEAAAFLTNIKQFRFNYQPAHSAFLEIFAPGEDFHTLLSIVATGNASGRNLKRLAALITGLEPDYIVKNLNEYTSFSGHLQGSSRAQFSNKLYKALDISSRWHGLKQAQGRQADPKDTDRFEEKLSTLLNKAIEVLADSEKGNDFSTAVSIGASVCLSCISEALSGQSAHRVSALNHALLKLPEIELDEDFNPIESDLRKLLEPQSPASESPESIIEVCLNRHEYKRARFLAGSSEEPEQLIQTIEEKKIAVIDDLRTQCDQAEEDIEEINLLGMLSGSIRAGEPSADCGDSTYETVRGERAFDHSDQSRTQLLTKLSDVRSVIETAEKDVDTDLRNAVETLSKITEYVGGRKQARQAQLEREIKEQIPRLREGDDQDSDKQYVRRQLEDLLAVGDNVALAELLNRVDFSIRNGTAIERVTTDCEPLTDDFLNEYEHLEDLKKGRKLREGIRNGVNVDSLQFANRDKSHRERALAAINAWDQLRSKSVLKRGDREIESAARDILTFVGIADILRMNPGEATGHDKVRFEAELSAQIPCPIPSFGSELGGSLAIIMFGPKQQPRKIVQVVKQAQTVKGGVLVIHLEALSARQRLDIRDLCLREKVSCIILDFPLLAFLCGQRDPLLTLFDVSLPLTWSQPYQMKGVKVPTEMFVGRDGHIAGLRDPGGSCIVFGGRQLGKSALLRHLAEEHHAPAEGLFIGYKDIDDLGNPPQKHAEMEEDLWFRISQELAHIGFLSEKEQTTLSRGKITKRNARTQIPQLIRLRLQEQKNQQLILLLDEVDDMLDMDSTADFRVVKSFRALMTETGQQFKVVFTGLKSVQRFNAYENQPFAQLGNALVVRPLPAPDAEQLVRRPLRALGYSFETPGLLLRILSQSNYHPGLIQIFCYRLVDNLNSQRMDGRADSVITRNDVNLVERNPDFMEDVRNRFDWTLDLDERYKVLTYALVMSDSATLEMTVLNFKAVGESWWPQVFEHMDFQTMKGLLDEMEGLGVLLKIQDGNQLTYRLRNPNLLRLLGSKNEIESEMQRIIERPSPTKRNPRNFHKLIDDKRAVFGPLTMEQESQISETSAVFRIALVYGSNALGLNSSEDQIRHLMRSLGDDYGHPWKELILPANIFSGGEKNLASHLKQKFNPHKRPHLFALCNLNELPLDINPSDLLHALVVGPGRVCKSLSQGRIFLFADEMVSWNLIRDKRFRQFVSNQTSIVEIFLRRWSDGSIAKALDDLNLKTRARENGELIFSKSHGLHSVVEEALQILQANTSSISAETVEDAIDTAISRATEPDSGRGIEIADSELRKLLLEILELGSGQSGDRLDWDDTVDLLEESYPELLSDNGRPFRKWIQVSGVGGPVFKDGQISLVSYANRLIN